MGNVIKLKKGNALDIPELALAEISYNMDSKELMLGTYTGNKKIGGESVVTQVTDHESRLDIAEPIITDHEARLDIAEPKITELQATSVLSNMARQAIINGNFDIWQRGTSFLNPANGSYTADRYRIIKSDVGTLPNITISKQSLTAGSIPNSANCCRINFDGAGVDLGTGAYYIFSQSIEHATRFLAGLNKKITVSFYAKCSAGTRKLGVKGIQRYGTGGSPSSPENLVGGSYFTISTTPEKFSATLTTADLAGKTFGSNNDDLIEIDFGIIWGSAVAEAFGDVAEQLFGGSGYVEITQIEVCSGDVALSFEPKSYDNELKSCMRYYQIVSSTRTSSCVYNYNGALRSIIHPSVPLRYPGTIIQHGVRGTDWALTEMTDAVNTTGTFDPLLYINTEIGINFNGGTFTAGTLYHVNALTTSGWLVADCEL